MSDRPRPNLDLDVRDDPSAEAEFLRDLVRAEETDLPTPEEMDALVARLAPVIATPARASRAKLGLAAVAVVVTLGGAWLVTSASRSGGSGGSGGPAALSATEAPSAASVITPTAISGPVVASAESIAAPIAPIAPVQAEAHAGTPTTDVPSERATAPTIDVTALPRAATSAPAARASASPSSCTDEVALLDRAGSALRAGDADRALSLTREHTQRCPSGAFVQERERIAIEALANAGQLDAMGERARAFEQRFPASPHLRRIQRLVEKHSEP